LIEEVAWPQRDLSKKVFDPGKVIGAGAADHPDDLVSLLQEELSEVRSVLSSDPGHKRPRHRLSTQLNQCESA
jgi:hypothetical protein